MQDRVFNLNFIKICLISISLQAVNQIVMSVLPLSLQSLGLAPSLLGVATACSSFTAMVTRPVGGLVADRKSRRLATTIGMTMMTLSMVGLAWFPYAAAIIMIRIMQGAGYSMASTAHYAVATDVLPPSRVQKGLSYFGICTTIAAALGPAIAFPLIAGGSYTPAWLAGAAIFAVGLILSVSLTYESKGETRVQKPARQEGGLWQFFEKSALLPSFVQVVLMVASSGMLVFLPTYAVELGISDISLFYTLQAVAMLAANLLSASLLPRMRSPLPLLLISIGGFAASIVALWTATGAVSLYAAALLYGLGFGMSTTVVSVLSMYRAAPERRGAASATYQCAGDIGYCIGSLTWGFVANAVGYRSLYGILTVLPVIAAVMCVMLFGKKAQTAQG